MSPEPDIAEYAGSSKEELFSKLQELSRRMERLRSEHDRCARDSETQGLLASIVEHSGDAILAYSLDGIITAWNRSAERIYGYTAKEAIGSSFTIILPPELPNEMPRILDSIREGRTVDHHETVRRKKDGQRRIVWLTVSPVFDAKGNIVGASSISRDITDMRRMEAELATSEQKYRRIVETAEEGIVLLDANDRITFANQKLADMMGYPIDEIVGEEIYKLMDDESRGCIAAILARNRKGAKVQFDFRFMRKDGTYAWAIVPTSPFFDERGKYAGALYMISDISDHIRTEDELQAARLRAEMYVDLMAHDINNLNQTALGYLELAIDTVESKGKLEKDHDDYLLKPIDALQSSSRLISNVRALQRSAVGAVNLKEVNVRKMLEDIQSQYSNVKTREVKVSFHASSDCQVMANELLSEVFSNIVSNSIKHSAGPIEIDIGLSQSFERGKAYCKVSIEDNGPGIADNVKAMLFMRFQRGHTQAAGRGLGLYLVKTLIDTFNGMVWVEDRVPGDYKKGSRFVVMLPVI